MLSCGSGVAPSSPTMLTTRSGANKRLGYETFMDKRASSVELQRSAVLQATQGERTIRDNDNLMENQVRQANLLDQSTPSALMEIIRTPNPQKGRKSKSLALHKVDLDEIQIPEMHEGLCRVFCQPNSWSPAFASSGEFTIKMESVYQEGGEICFRIAVMCCCAKSIWDGSRIKPALKRQYYVSCVERTEKEICQLTEALSLQYLGHDIADKLPTHGTRIIRKQRALDEYGDQVIQFLSSLMLITAIGFNRLVALKDSVSSNVRMRDFLGLAIGFGDQTIVATSSCAARIEGQDGGDRPVLPSAWLDIDLNTSDVSSYRKWRIHGNNDFSPLVRSNCLNQSGAGKCVRFIDPCYWLDETPNDGLFTVEITSVSVMDGVAKYTISVLYFANGDVEVMTVDRRYSEFDELALALETKVPSLQLRNLLPPKTFFRYLSASYLERRAASLQLFLERMLRLTFRGVLDEEIPLTAEPFVRKFLHLPAVEWIVVPWSKLSPTPKTGRDGFRSNLSLSPTAASEFSPDNLSPRRNLPCHLTDSTVFRYESFLFKRSDSM